MDKKSRSTYIDVVKAFAIICVVCGHCIQYGSGNEYLSQGLFFDNLLFKFIYSFHMPLFMLISGYLFAFAIGKEEWTQLIYSRIRSLLTPIIIWSVLPWIVYVIRTYNGVEDISILLIIKSFFGNFYGKPLVFVGNILVLALRYCYKSFF